MKSGSISITDLLNLFEMSINRQRFIDKVRENLIGAFGEYMCRQVALSVKKPDNWSDEVSLLLLSIPKYMNRTLIKTTFKDRDKAMKEAIYEASLMSSKITYAKNKIISYYPAGLTGWNRF